MYLKPTELKSRNYVVTQDEHWSKCFPCKGNLQWGKDIPAHQQCVESKPRSDSERRLKFFLLIPWVEINEDKLLKMFEGIIPKEYPTHHMDYMDNAVISQQDQTKDS